MPTGPFAAAKIGTFWVLKGDFVLSAGMSVGISCVSSAASRLKDNPLCFHHS